MENEAELIRQQMFETRSALTEKLETLEEQVAVKVLGTTESVKENVTETVESVKEAVAETAHTVEKTVENLAEAVNLPRHFEEHPWVMLGGAVLLGFVAERIIDQDRSAAALPRSLSNGSNGKPETPLWEDKHPASKPAWRTNLTEAVTPALKQASSLAIGATTGIVGELIHDSIPEPMWERVEDILDQVTVALGGRPIHPTRLPRTSSIQKSTAHVSQEIDL
jgi:ElaB/YqjD/DUF883 family membrane-anchored ribosome-binding protein